MPGNPAPVVDAQDGRRTSQWAQVVRPPFAVRPDGGAIAATTGRGATVRLDCPTGQTLARLVDVAYPMAWSPNGGSLAVGMCDPTVMLLEIEAP